MTTLRQPNGTGAIPRAWRSPIDGRPCANCAGLVGSRRSTACYCSQMCGLAADVARRYRRAATAGQLDHRPAVAAVELKLRQLVDGDYDPPPSLVPLFVREAAARAFGSGCFRCGERATEAVPAPGQEPADAGDVWLLCARCYRHHAHSLCRPDAEDTRRLLLRRATIAVPRQPCDTTDWNHRAWLRGTATSPPDARARWEAWVGPRLSPATVADAIAGFPAELDAWSWYAP